MSQSCASSSIQSKHLIMIPISEEPAFTKHLCGARSQDTPGRTWKNYQQRDSDTLWRTSRNARLRKRGGGHGKIPLTRVGLAPTYASRIFYPTTRACGTPFAGKPRNYPPANPSGSCVLQVWCYRRPAFSLTPLIRCLLGSLFSSLIEPSRFLSLLSLVVHVWFLAMAFVSFKAFDILMVRSPQSEMY